MAVSIQAVQLKDRLRWLARTPGCGDDCSDRYGHDPAAHEAYGAEQERLRRSTAVIVTGRLTIDLGMRELRGSDGREIWLSPSEWRILAACAERFGQPVPWRDLIAANWGDDWMAETPKAAIRALRSHLRRLRSRLGADAPMLATRKDAGLVLLKVPVGEAPPNDMPTKVMARWARDYDACSKCGRSDQPYQARGLCTCCYHRRMP